MDQKISDKISYELYSNDKDGYFDDKLLPSLIYKIFMSTAPTLSSDSIERCEDLKNQLCETIHKNGYKNINVENVLKYFPIFASDNLDLLGEYIINTPFCMFLDKVDSNPNELVIKLNGESTNNDLNVFGGLLKNGFGFKNCIVVYDYNPNLQINFLKLKHIIDVDNKMIINPKSNLWLEYVQLCYVEIFMSLTIYHAIWHLMTAYITCVIKENVKDREIVKLFTMVEQNIFLKANEVKTFFLQSPLIFNTILYDNKNFMEYASNWINNFVDTFDIDTHFNKYILRGVLNPNQLWMVGFKENLNLLKGFSKSIIDNTNHKFHMVPVWNWNGYKNINCNVKSIKLAKLLEILYTLGSVYHSYTFEFQKIGFTDLFYCEKIPKNIYRVLLSTLEWNENFPIFGDFDNEPNKYSKNLQEFKNQIEGQRKIITKIVESNQIYKSFIYTNTILATENYSINTPNTRV